MLSQFFRKKESSAAPQQPELVSVHIPKTAGTSFRHLLKTVYGEEAVIRLDIPILDPRLRINEQLMAEDVLPSRVAVIHGHFNVATLRERFPQTASLPLITWLRHPVDRVISNYFYLSERLAEELDEEGKDLNILSKMQRTLLEYARDEKNRNRQSKFLDGTPLNAFTFVGIQEFYADEVAAMAREFHWNPAIAAPQHNRTANKREVSEQTRAEIAALNAIDLTLYEEGLQLRAKRQGPPKIDLISIHLPKTGGTSFYNSLRQVYGNDVSASYSRKSYLKSIEDYGDLMRSMNGNKSVLHGHLYYHEIADINKAQNSKLICWLREPIGRLLSNYHFFKAGLKSPDRNPESYRINKHRKNESLLTYANRAENQNVMSRFLAGVPLEDFFFIGFLENYAEGLSQLGELLHWPKITAVRMNVGAAKSSSALPDPETIEALRLLNTADIALYERARQLAENSLPTKDT